MLLARWITSLYCHEQAVEYQKLQESGPQIHSSGKRLYAGAPAIEYEPVRCQGAWGDTLGIDLASWEYVQCLQRSSAYPSSPEQYTSRPLRKGHY